MNPPERYVLTKGNRQLEVEIHPDGRVEIVACCLKTDSWEDYLAFKGQAREATERGDQKAARRNLRAALVSLFSHVEGVVNEIHDAHEIPRVERGDSLSARAGNVALEAARRTTVPPLNFTLGKYLRDVIAHPGIGKTFRDGTSQTPITECTVYEFLDLPTVDQLEATIEPWLDAVFSAFGVERFPGETEMEDFVEALRELSPNAIQEHRSRTERSINLLPLKIVVTDAEPDAPDDE